MAWNRVAVVNGGGEPVRKETVCAPGGGGRERGSQQAL